MANPKGPKGFIVVTPTGIIEIPQDSYLSWLTMFYLMPRVLVEKWPEALKIPRKSFEALRSQACLDIIKQDMFAELVWDCWSWTAWQFFQGQGLQRQLWRNSRQPGAVHRLLPALATLLRHTSLLPTQDRA